MVLVVETVPQTWLRHWKTVHQRVALARLYQQSRHSCRHSNRHLTILINILIRHLNRHSTILIEGQTSVQPRLLGGQPECICCVVAYLWLWLYNWEGGAGHLPLEPHHQHPPSRPSWLPNHHPHQTTH